MNPHPTTPQTPINLSSESVNTVRLATDIQVRYSVQGDPLGNPIVFIHGWPDSGYSFGRVTTHLPTELRAYRYDQRGFGDTTRPLDGYSIDHFAADVVALLDAVGLDRATLVGHSFGSFVARRVAERYPRRVSRLVLIGSAITPNNAVTREVLEIAATLEDPIPNAFVREFQASTLHIPVPETFFEQLVVESNKAPARVWRDSFANLLKLNDEDELGRIAAPTLIVWGEHDGLFAAREEQEQLAAAIPDAHLVVYAETGHSPNWERPERVARDIAAFLN